MIINPWQHVMSLRTGLWPWRRFALFFVLNTVQLFMESYSHPFLPKYVCHFLSSSLSLAACYSPSLSFVFSLSSSHIVSLCLRLFLAETRNGIQRLNSWETDPLYVTWQSIMSWLSNLPIFVILVLTNSHYREWTIPLLIHRTESICGLSQALSLLLRFCLQHTPIKKR